MSLRKVHAVNCDCEQCADNRVLSEFFDLDGPPEIPDVEQIRQQAARECAEELVKLMKEIGPPARGYYSMEAIYNNALADGVGAILRKFGIEEK